MDGVSVSASIAIGANVNASQFPPHSSLDIIPRCCSLGVSNPTLLLQYRVTPRWRSMHKPGVQTWGIRALLTTPAVGIDET